MKLKILSVVMIVMLLVMTVSLVKSQESSDDTGLTVNEKEKISEKVSEVSDLPEKVATYVEEFAEKKGVNPEQINNISEVDFNSLPKEVNIENVDDSNLAIYQVDYNETNSEFDSTRQLFVITYSTEQLKKQGDLIIASDKRQFLHFGSSGSINAAFLYTATGVEGSLEKGYVMMREGSITGISTNLDIINSTENSEIEVVIYKNGEPIRFSNIIDSSETGIEKDYDIQSNGVVTFQAGDVISAYAYSSNEGVEFESVITLVEITTK